MGLTDLGAVPLSIIASLVLAVVLLAVRQRENRQETERLKYLVGAYRALAGSFSPATAEQQPQIEGALADSVLFGSVPQVELAARCAQAVVAAWARA